MVILTSKTCNFYFFFFYTTWYELVVYSFPGNADIFRTSIVTIKHVWPFEHESSFNKKFSLSVALVTLLVLSGHKRLVSTPLDNSQLKICILQAVLQRSTASQHFNSFPYFPVLCIVINLHISFAYI